MLVAQGAHRTRVLRRERDAADRALRVLQFDKARERVVNITAVADRVADVVEVERAVCLHRDGIRVHPTERRRAAHLVLEGVRRLADDHLVAGAAVGEDSNKVAHRAARDEQPCLLPHTLGGECLQPLHGGVVAPHVISHLGVGHRLAHFRRRPGDGIAAQIDCVHAVPHVVAFTVFRKYTRIAGFCRRGTESREPLQQGSRKRTPPEGVLGAATFSRGGDSSSLIAERVTD